jgi:hypothetical protein
MVAFVSMCKTVSTVTFLFLSVVVVFVFSFRRSHGCGRHASTRAPASLERASRRPNKVPTNSRARTGYEPTRGHQRARHGATSRRDSNTPAGAELARAGRPDRAPAGPSASPGTHGPVPTVRRRPPCNDDGCSGRRGTTCCVFSAPGPCCHDAGRSRREFRRPLFAPLRNLNSEWPNCAGVLLSQRRDDNSNARDPTTSCADSWRPSLCTQITQRVHPLPRFSGLGAFEYSNHDLGVASVGASRRV